MNALYKRVQQNLYTIDWDETVQFAHEYKQKNVDLLRMAIYVLGKDAADDADASPAARVLDELLWQID